MKPTKPIVEWQNIFLDTSFIIDFLSDPERFNKNPEVKRRIEITHRVMEILSAYDKEGNKSRRNFFISAVTLGELRKLSVENMAKDLVLLFSTGDVTFVDYTKDIALLLQRTLEDSLPSGQKHQFISFLEKELKARNYANARQWVSDDLKIVASAKFVKRLDVALTSDKNTFKLIADTLDVPCVSMFIEDFEQDLFGDISIIPAKKSKQ